MNVWVVVVRLLVLKVVLFWFNSLFFGFGFVILVRWLMNVFIWFLGWVFMKLFIGCLFIKVNIVGID